MIELLCGCAIGAAIGTGSVWTAKCSALSEAQKLAEWRLGECNGLESNLAIKEILLAAKSAAVDDLLKEIERISLERSIAGDELAAIKRARSRAVSRGNKTRALRRRGGLLPAPINDITADHMAGAPRNSLTG